MKTTAYPRWNKQKVPASLIKLLKSYPEFSKEPETIIPVFLWSVQLSKLVHKNEGQPVTYYSQDIFQRFRPYTSTSYKPFLNVLEREGLLEINHIYRIGNERTEGICKSYRITDKMYGFLNDGLRDYLVEYSKPKSPLRRRLQKNISF